MTGGLFGVGSLAATQAIHGDGDVGIPWGALTHDERLDVIAQAHRYLALSVEHPDVYGARAPRAQVIVDQAGILGFGGGA